MQDVKKSLFCVLLAGIAGPAFGQGTGPLAIEDRSVGASQTAPAAASEDGVMLLMQQLQQYEQDLSELRGVVEEMRHEMEQMREASRERYLDLDGRINAVAGAAASTGAAPDAAAGQGSATDSAEPSPPANDEKADRKAYMTARDLLLDRKFDQAGDSFRQYLNDYPAGQFRDWSWFWLGKIALSKAEPDTKTAEQAFQTVVNDFPQSTKVPSALYQIAILEANTGDTSRARVTLNKLVKQFPESSEAPLAKDMLEQLK